ncbi:MAG: adenylate/guanylate cyclase domain-containing protein [Verrucomicrobiae bacterium]|nr:adenylate/guanylate cyclase domain-containing protein [Verrucomicrobiae bacterium]
MATKGKSRGYLMPLLAPLAVAGLLAAVEHLDLSQQLENVTVDRRFKAREPYDPPVDSRILLVGIDEYSLKQVGRWQDWTREVHALFLDRLALRRPRVVAYDLLFTESSKSSTDPEIDQKFGDQLARFEGAITGAFVKTDTATAVPEQSPVVGKTRSIDRFLGNYEDLVSGSSGAVPIEPVAESSWTGFVNTPPSNIDATRRKIPLVVGYRGKVFPSLVLQMLIQYEGGSVSDVEIRLGDSITYHRKDGEPIRIPVDRQGAMVLNYRGRDAFKPYGEYIRLMQDINEHGEEETLPDPMPPVDGQILLIGQMAEGLTDFGSTPFSPLEPLVLVQAVALNNILQGDYLRPVPLWQILLGWLPLAWATLFGLRRASVSWSAAVPIALVAAYVTVAFVVFRTHSWQIPVFLPVLGFLVVNGHALIDRIVLEMRAKSRIKNLFGTYVSPEVVESMVSSGEDPKLGGQTAEITAFFSDVQSFSTFSEKLDAERLVSLMIDYLTAMTDILVYRGGTLDKYIGDAIVGMFGAPLHFPDHAYRACTATIEMQQKQAELREKWLREGGWPEIVYQMQTRIGLNTGPAVIGNMGSPRRFNYTMMGDTVNLAARCESGAKSYGVYTMVTGETRSGAREEKDDIAFRYLDKIVVKGRSRPAEIYEVIGFTSDLSSRVADCIALYGGGIEKYLARDWDGARSAFEKSAQLEPFQPGSLPGVETNPSMVMIGRCRVMKEQPPGEDWDGRYVMTSK